MSEKVKYEISVADLSSRSLSAIALSAGSANRSIQDAKKETDTFGGSLKKLAVNIGLAALAYKGFSFLKESVEDFDAAEQASAQLDATLKSTAFAAGLSREALDEQSMALSKITKYDDDAIAGMQSLLLTFTEIKGAVFQEATPAILDLAEKMGGDLKGASIQVGKALNDPIKGVAALGKVGVSFTEQQKKMIKTLVETGHQADAQRIILAELGKEFGGSAEAAANAGTGGLTVLANRFGNIKESIGGLIVGGLQKLYPILSKVMDVIEAAPTFFKEYATEIKTAGVFIGVLAYGLAAYTIVVNATVWATQLWTGAQWLLNIALTANPIGLLVAGIAAFAAGIYYAWEKSETFRSTLYGLWEVGKVLLDTFLALGKALIFPTPDNITNAISSLKNLGDNVSTAYSTGKEKGKQSFAKSQAEKEEKPSLKKIAKMNAGADKSSKPSSMAKGSKPTIINVQIKNLIENVNIQKEGFKETVSEVKSVLVKGLVGAVNDFQRTAGA